MNDMDEPKKLKRWKGVDDLCKPSNSFKCWSSGLCVCGSTVNKPLTGNENRTLPY